MDSLSLFKLTSYQKYILFEKAVYVILDFPRQKDTP